MEESRKIFEEMGKAFLKGLDAGIKSAEEVIRWIPVEEQQPPERGKYLCTAESLGYSYVIVGHYNNPGWMNDYCGQRVVAWQPLPEPYCRIT